jgi:hypothetical protein
MNTDKFAAPSLAHDLARSTGVVGLLVASTFVAYLGLRVHEPLCVAPLLSVVGGLVLKRGSALRTVLFAIATFGCVSVAAFALWILVLAMILRSVTFG